MRPHDSSVSLSSSPSQSISTSSMKTALTSPRGYLVTVPLCVNTRKLCDGFENTFLPSMKRSNSSRTVIP